MKYTREYGVICAFGDSITWGAWDYKYHGWVTRLQLSIEERFGYKHNIYNIGVGGDTSRELLGRIDKESAQRFESHDAHKWFQRKNNSMLI